MSYLYEDAGPAPADGRKVMLATTAYDSPDASYTDSIAKSREAMHKAGLSTAYVLLQGNCHVDDARNSLVAAFLRSDCSELVFLDADVSWRPEQLITLCGHDCDVVGGVYPYRRDGHRDTMPVRHIKGIHEADKDGLLEVAGLPTGFMRIRRHVLEKLAETSGWFRDKNGEDWPEIFRRQNIDGERMGGDINFCRQWRDLGGKVHASTELVLGHSGKVVFKGSLAGLMRRRTGQTLSWVCEKVRNETDNADAISEALAFYNNQYFNAPVEVLGNAIAMARKAQGPIIEAGSGLSTILMAVASKHPVWCIEHSTRYAVELQEMAAAAGVKNIYLVKANIGPDGWYDLSEDMDALPEKFAVGFVDGPPRIFGDRMKFFEVFGDRVTAILVDDADDPEYRDKLETWAAGVGKVLFMPTKRAAAIVPPELRQMAAE